MDSSMPRHREHDALVDAPRDCWGKIWKPSWYDSYLLLCHVCEGLSYNNVDYCIQCKAPVLPSAKVKVLSCAQDVIETTANYISLFPKRRIRPKNFLSTYGSDVPKRKPKIKEVRKLIDYKPESESKKFVVKTPEQVDAEWKEIQRKLGLNKIKKRTFLYDWEERYFENKQERLLDQVCKSLKKFHFTVCRRSKPCKTHEMAQCSSIASQFLIGSNPWLYRKISINEDDLNRCVSCCSDTDSEEENKTKEADFNTAYDECVVTKDYLPENSSEADMNKYNFENGVLNNIDIESEIIKESATSEPATTYKKCEGDAMVNKVIAKPCCKKEMDESNADIKFVIEKIIKECESLLSHTNGINSEQSAITNRELSESSCEIGIDEKSVKNGAPIKTVINFEKPKGPKQILETIKNSESSSTQKEVINSDEPIYPKQNLETKINSESSSTEKRIKKLRAETNNVVESTNKMNEKMTVSLVSSACDVLNTSFIYSKDSDLPIPEEKNSSEKFVKSVKKNSKSDNLKNISSSSKSSSLTSEELASKSMHEIPVNTEQSLATTNIKNICDKSIDSKSQGNRKRKSENSLDETSKTLSTEYKFRNYSNSSKKSKMNPEREISTDIKEKEFLHPEDKITRSKKILSNSSLKTGDSLVLEKEVSLPPKEKRTRRKTSLASTSLKNEASSYFEIETQSPPNERLTRRKRISSSSSLKTDDSSVSEIETSLSPRDKLTGKKILSSCTSKPENNSLSEIEKMSEEKLLSESVQSLPSNKANKPYRRDSRIKEIDSKTKSSGQKIEFEKIREEKESSQSVEISPSNKANKPHRRDSKIKEIDSKSKSYMQNSEVEMISEEKLSSLSKEILPSNKASKSHRRDSKMKKIDSKTKYNAQKTNVDKIREENLSSQSVEILPSNKASKSRRRDSKLKEIDSRKKLNVHKPEVEKISEEKLSSQSVEISPLNKASKSHRRDSKNKELDSKTKSNVQKADVLIEENKDKLCLNVEYSRIFPYISMNSYIVSLPIVSIKFQTDGIHLELPKAKGSSRTFSILLSDLVVDKLLVYCDANSVAFVSITTSSTYGQYLKDKLEIKSETSQYYINYPEKKALDELKILFLMHGVSKGLIPFLCKKYSAKKLCIVSQEAGRKTLTSTSESESSSPVKYSMYTHIKSILVTKEDIDRLGSRRELNDTVIDTYLNYIYHEEIPKEFQDRTHIFGAFFWINVLNKACQRKKELDMKSVKCVKDVDLFSKDFIFVPINRGKHWYLAVICFLSQVNKKTVDIVLNSAFETRKAETSKDKDSSPKTRRKDYFYLDKGMPCICFFDSLDRRQHLNGDKVGIARTLKEFLKMLWKSRHPTESCNLDNLLFLKALCPQQENRYDCGIYLLQYVESFFKNPIPYFANPMPDLRSWFCKTDIMHKRTKIKNVLIKVKEKQPETTTHFEPSCSSDVIALS